MNIETYDLDKYIASQYAKLLRNLIEDTNNVRLKFFLDKFCLYAGIEHIPFNVDLNIGDQNVANSH